MRMGLMGKATSGRKIRKTQVGRAFSQQTARLVSARFRIERIDHLPGKKATLGHSRNGPKRAAYRIVDDRKIC